VRAQDAEDDAAAGDALAKAQLVEARDEVVLLDQRLAQGQLLVLVAHGLDEVMLLE
jgi:hypothetical protein